MSDTVIQVESLGKKYLIRHLQKGEQQFGYVALRDVLAEKARRLLKQRTRDNEPGAANEEFWALRDVSFKVKQGERLGIIGRNGAGKSTLLKVLSRITEPTCGRVRIKGRVASLLEVGTGFHPELTGRENIFLNGAILGMHRWEIRKKFDEIVAFAEVEKFLDTPVKRYSSGMYVRLAFAVAAHLEPEILIVDEVLAVGDAAFQKKCLGKMGDVAAKEGRTVLFVSHNMAAVVSLCDSCLLLAKGRTDQLGKVQDTVARYLRASKVVAAGFVDLSSRMEERYGPQQYAVLKSLRVLDPQDTPADLFKMGDTVRVRLEIDFKRAGTDFEVGLAIANLYNVNLHYFISNWEGLEPVRTPGVKTIEVEIPALLLFPGNYHFNVWVKRQGERYDDGIHEALDFRVEEAQVNQHYAYFQRYSQNTQVYAPSKWRLL